MSQHRCVFDSSYGVVSGRRNQALMCACGRWAMPAGGRWESVPRELLPEACRIITWFQKLFWALGKNAFGIAIIAVMALFLWLV